MRAARVTRAHAAGSRAAGALAFLLAAAPAGRAELPAAAPEPAESLQLREAGPRYSAAPKIAEDLPSAVPSLAPAPLARTASLAEAQAVVLRAPQAWRNWAALAHAHYAAGNYEKAMASARQMMAAAEARKEHVSLEAAELFAKCKRAAEALTLLE